jgi:hypothetical protein
MDHLVRSAEHDKEYTEKEEYCEGATRNGEAEAKTAHAPPRVGADKVSEWRVLEDAGSGSGRSGDLAAVKL